MCAASPSPPSPPRLARLGADARARSHRCGPSCSRTRPSSSRTTTRSSTSRASAASSRASRATPRPSELRSSPSLGWTRCRPSSTCTRRAAATATRSPRTRAQPSGVSSQLDPLFSLAPHRPLETPTKNAPPSSFFDGEAPCTHSFPFSLSPLSVVVVPSQLCCTPRALSLPRCNPI